MHPCGIGLGLRWAFLDDLLAAPIDPSIAFFEVSPENYMRRGGYFPAALHRVQSQRPLLTHGLMLGVGASAGLDRDYLAGLRGFLDELGVDHHSDHLCWVGGRGACLHELLPLPFRSATARHVADQLRRAQDVIHRPIALENISYYAGLSHDPALGRAEQAFICEVLERADCGLLLDLNNVAVNAHNHGYDPHEFIAGLPLARVVQIHVAGGERRPQLDDLIIDTHGATVSAEVAALLAWTLPRAGPLPVLYERDHDIPPYPALVQEARELHAIYTAALAPVPPQEKASRPIDLSPGTASPKLSPGTASLPTSTHLSPETADASARTGLSRETAPVSPDLSPGTGDPVLAALQAAIIRQITAPETNPAHAEDPEAAALLRGAGHLGVYRPLVRDALAAAVTQFLPRTRARRGPAFTTDLTAWMAVGGPRSRLLRDIPGEFLALVTPRWDADGPVWLSELARHELLEFRVAAAPPRPPASARAFTLDARLALETSAVLVRYSHAVHLLPEDEHDRSEPAASATVLLAYRDVEHRVRYLQLTPLAEAVVAALQASATVQEAVLAGAAAEAAALDDEHLARISALLADLVERGVIVGVA